MKLTTFQFKNDNWFPNAPEIPDNKETLVLVFGSPMLDISSNVLDKLQQSCEGVTLLGCSTAGEIFDQTVNDESISVAVTSFEKSSIRLATAAVSTATDSRSIGKKLAEELSGPNLKGIYVISDGLHVNGTELVRGLSESLPDHVTITGGLAGDGDRFNKTWVITNKIYGSKQVAAVGFYGDHIHLNHGSKGGWDTFGPSRLITKSNGNILYELDGKPALAVYKEYLGERASGLPATALLFPLAISDRSGESPKIVRTILSINEEDQSLTFAGDVPQENYGTFMRANFDRLVDGAERAAASANQNTSDDLLCLAVSCVGRRLILGERTEEEIEAISDALPKQTKVIGFYSYGEISPSKGRSCDLHNQTMTITTLSESGD